MNSFHLAIIITASLLLAYLLTLFILAGFKTGVSVALYADQKEVRIGEELTATILLINLNYRTAVVEFADTCNEPNLSLGKKYIMGSLPCGFMENTKALFPFSITAHHVSVKIVGGSKDWMNIAGPSSYIEEEGVYPLQASWADWTSNTVEITITE